MELAYQEQLTGLGLSILVGALIGAEREYRDKSAGLRTMILVCLGSCLFTQLSFVIGGSHSTDRIAANVLTGIGFLGAGVIFKGKDRVDGITTATTIWMVAALGMALGAGYYQIALLCTLAVLIILMFFIYLLNIFEKLNRTRVYRIVCPYEQKTLAHYEQLFSQYKLRFDPILVSKTEETIMGTWTVSGPDKAHNLVIQQIIADERILEFDY